MSVNSTFRFLRVYLQYYGGRMEMLYALLMSACAVLTGSYQVYLFCIHLIIITCVYIGAFRMRDHANPVLTLFLFYMLYYNQSLNISRQFVAMAILFAAAKDIEIGKHKRYLMFVLAAFLFHMSGLLGAVPLVIYHILYPKKRLQAASFQKRIFLCILLIVGTVCFIPVMKFVIRSGIIPRRYLVYFENDNESSYLSARLFILPEVLGLILFLRQIRKRSKNADFYLFDSICFVLLYQISPFIAFGKRIPAYFSFLNLITIGMMIKSVSPGNRRVITVLTVLIACFYWAFLIVFANANKTIPYVFCFA